MEKARLKNLCRFPFSLPKHSASSAACLIERAAAVALMNPVTGKIELDFRESLRTGKWADEEEMAGEKLCVVQKPGCSEGGC